MMSASTLLKAIVCQVAPFDRSESPLNLLGRHPDPNQLKILLLVSGDSTSDQDDEE